MVYAMETLDKPMYEYVTANKVYNNEALLPTLNMGQMVSLFNGF